MDGGLSVSTPLLERDGLPPVLIGDVRDVRLDLRKKRQGLVKLEQRADIILLVRHARRLFADLLDLLGVAFDINSPKDGLIGG